MDIELLRTVSIMRDLTEPELTAVAALFTRRDVKNKEKILVEGEPVSNFYIVYDGVAHVRRLAQKREMLLGTITKGKFFGEVNLFDPGVSTASIYAMKDVKLAVCDYATLRAFMSENPATGYKIVTGIMSEMSRRLRTTSARLANSIYWTADEKLQAPGPM
ncbi:MAG: cyclic nucleotide-binding domain-containing protein [Chthoniobacteraceae bacterium]